MAESSLRAPDLGAKRGVSSCLEKCQKSSPGTGRQPFSGKSFYLDLPASMNLQFLTGAIQQLGGVIEGFLSKEVSYIVSSRREAKAESGGMGHSGCPTPSEVRVETSSMANPKVSHTRPSQKPVDSVLMSRGKELLQKAIRNQGSSSRGGSGSSSSLLANARSWGVRILHVDEMMMHVQQLSLGSLCVKKQEPKKPEGTRPAVESRTRKVARLKAPFLKVEDESRKFRPFHYQFKSFPEISFLGSKNASPFEALMTPGSSHHTREPKDQVPSLQSATRTMPRRKKGYCECCQEAFEELHVHLQSAQHRSFALKAHPYAEVDRIIAQLSHSFTDIAFQASLPRQSGSPASECDPPCAETLPPSLPSQSRAASSRMKKEDDCQAPRTPEQAATVDSTKAPAEPVGAGKAAIYNGLAQPWPAAHTRRRGWHSRTTKKWEQEEAWPGFLALHGHLPLCRVMPPTLLYTDPQEHMKQRRGQLQHLPSSLPQALSWGPALTFPLSPGCGQSPLWGPLSALLCLFSSSCPPRVLLRGQCLTCQLPPHPLPSLPPSHSPSPKTSFLPISCSQAINLETEMGLLSILWPLFFFITICTVVLLTLLCFCVFVSLNVEATRSLVLFSVSFQRRKGGPSCG
ncbi:PREDICTED: protein DBF4 homolog B [Galeopterus variegatus]|uniref:Protein DBF4 homolog B n=1 Tax=Galeopterus variegatus TaxID=482537 RepID=A0ABM0R7E3_GALVR|nr:PREDICTED: protein DBF4 homolog B [Galeopterus variegatus]